MASILKFLGLLLLIDAGWLLLKLADAYSYTPEAGICYQLGRCTSISPGVSSLVIFFHLAGRNNSRCTLCQNYPKLTN